MLPFYVDKLFRTDLEGTALPQRQGLKLVFHIPQEDQNLFEADVQEVLIAWNDLELIELKRKMFTATLYLTVKSDDSFPRQLKPKDNRLELSIRRRDKGKLDAFEKDLASLRAGEALDDTDEFVDDMRDFLDRM